MDQSISNELALSAFRAVDFDWTQSLDSVWHNEGHHVDELHRAVADEFMTEFTLKTENVNAQPVGRVLVGPKGAGKTHLIGRLRQRVWALGGWFVLLEFVAIDNFWRSAALNFITSLQRPMDGGAAQYEITLRKLAGLLDLAPQHQTAAARLHIRSENSAESLVRPILAGLRHRYAPQTQRHQDVVRALILLSSPDWDVSDLAFSWLQGQEIDETLAKTLDFVKSHESPAEIVRGLCWILGLSGPILIAVDEIDAIVTEHNSRVGAVSTKEESDKTSSVIEALATGLMDLHQVKGRAVTVVACLEATWEIIKDKAIGSAIDRFHDARPLKSIQSGEIVKRLIRGRLECAYDKQGFVPPHPTWPFAPNSFATAVNFSPRQLLQRCDKHRSECLANGQVSELSSFSSDARTDVPPPTSNLDAEYERLKTAAQVGDLLDVKKEDRLSCDLLVDVLRVYVRQTKTPDNVDLSVDADFKQRTPVLHGRLRFVYTDQGDRERHFCFRALEHSNAAAFQSRLRAAMTASGIDRALPFRKLFILRRAQTPGGAVTAKMVDELKRAGGRIINPTDDDLKSFVALQTFLHKAPEGLDDWLRARKPLCKTATFMEAGLCEPPVMSLGDQPPKEQPEGPAEPAPEPSGLPDPTSAKARYGSVAPVGATLRVVPLGRRIEGGKEGRPETLPANILPRHTAILASAGSGKTVMLRRIVEEAALIGMPAIVLDTNNDLARLGDSWPESPAEWSTEDAEKAEEYQKRVEVVVWTPGAAKGNPLYLALLPDFVAVGDDEDELDKAVQMATATLCPLIQGGGKTRVMQEAVLSCAMRYFARSGGGDLDCFIRLLADLPEGITEISNAEKLGVATADQLRAAIEKNPLMKSRGTPLDPALLFSASAEGRTRISVLNFSGLPTDESRQAFVNRLQMTLFAWIKKHPSSSGRLYVLDEAQNFAPSQKSTPCKESTLSLVAQARKYGLGMIFATQTPKGIDNKIISNCTTHFYGKMSAPATLTAVEEMAAARGGNARDFGTLTRGQFYFSTEGLAKPVKISTPLCLSYHPANPLSEDEVITLAGKDGVVSSS